MNTQIQKKFFFLFFLLSLTTAPMELKSETLSPHTDVALPLSNLAVPEEAGKVQERFNGNSSRTVIQIQDVHAHAVAQQNIAAILERLRTAFGIETVAMEGAWTSTSLPKSRAIPTSREKQLLAETLLDDDLVSGPAYAAIMSPNPITLVGVEDAALYEQNRAVFIAHLGKIQAIQEKLRTYSAALEDLQQSTWGSDLLAFGKAFGKFRDTSDLDKFFSLLLKTAKAQEVDISDLRQITLLNDIMTLERTFSKEKLEQEVKGLMREYKNMPWTLEELIRGGKIPAQKLGSYPEIKKLTRLYSLRDQISLRDLMAQIETLTGRVLAKLIRRPEENALWDKTERFYLAKRLLLLQATPADLQYYESEKSLLGSELASAGLSEDLDLSLNFYAAVKKRDEIFFDRITNDPALAGNIAIVTGGFHTDGLSQKFRAAGISYITITPELGDTSMNEKLYNTRMAEAPYKDPVFAEKQRPGLDGVKHGSPALESQTLSELRNAIGWIDDRFVTAFEVLRIKHDVREAVAAFLGKNVAVSNAQKAAHAYASGRVLSGEKTGIVTIPAIHEAEFTALSRPEQIATVRQLMEQADSGEQKAMLVSSVSVIAKMLSDSRSEARLAAITKSGDILALLQDIPATQMPASLLSERGVERFEATDMENLVLKTPRFQGFAKRRPFAIMKDGFQSERFVVLPEALASLVLYRIVTLNSNLYRAARNPEFLALLESLVAEILSQELPAKSA